VEAPAFYFVAVSGFFRLIATTAMTMSTMTTASTTAASFVTDDMAIGSVMLSGTIRGPPTTAPSLMYALAWSALNDVPAYVSLSA